MTHIGFLINDPFAVVISSCINAVLCREQIAIPSISMGILLGRRRSRNVIVLPLFSLVDDLLEFLFARGLHLLIVANVEQVLRLTALRCLKLEMADI